MTLSIYVDGSGGANSGYGFFVSETGESFYENKSDITNNQAEYMAIISALRKFENSNDEIKITFASAPSNDIEVMITSIKGSTAGTVAYS